MPQTAPLYTLDPALPVLLRPDGAHSSRPHAVISSAAVSNRPVPYALNVRDIETIDSELGLLLALRNMALKAAGRAPNPSRIDALLDERSAATFSGAQRPE